MMTTQQLTTRDIFAANQLLTLEAAKKLKGKQIACTSPEYRMNTPHVVQFVVGDIVSEWDHAATRVYPDQQGKYTQYNNYQQYWASYMSADKIDELKTTMLVLDNAGNWQYRCNTKYWMYSNTPTFHGSDVDRDVYYVCLPESEPLYMVIEYTTERTTSYLHGTGKFGLREAAVYYTKVEAQLHVERFVRELADQRGITIDEAAKYYDIEEVEEETED